MYPGLIFCHLSIKRFFISDAFHKNLRELLSRIIAEQLPNWRKQSIKTMGKCVKSDFIYSFYTQIIVSPVSLPQLVDFNWRVDIKTSADTLSRMSVPTCILQMQVCCCPCSLLVVLVFERL
jgi:hypothetical protein